MSINITSFKLFSKISLFALSTMLVSSVYSNPENGQVSTGLATISSPNANTVLIQQTSDKAVIDWRTFNISEQEKTQFQQPSSSSITLNRIDPAQGASLINGQLTANGQIWLINPAGIMFGATARVDTGGLLATTANISNQDFMAGQYHFVQSPDWHGAVINNGTITVKDAGMVALVAPGVENNGTIQANFGKVVLASGNEYVVDFYGDHLINFQLQSEVSEAAVTPDGRMLKNAVSNAGKIIANGGKVIMAASTASKVLDNSINMSGYIEAKTVAQQGGSIILMGGNEGTVKVSGKMDASGKEASERGGNIKILGKNVALVDNSILDASGYAGGGEILIGGDYQGKNPEIMNAEHTFVGSNVTINADALAKGDGGKVIVWANQDTRFYGNISACGGSEIGNGGFVEVSGKENLDFNGKVNTLATNGLTGTLLLDPRTLTIVNSGGTLNLTDTNSFSNTPATDGSINSSVINSALSNVILRANRDIIFNDNIAMTGSGLSLTVQAARSITISNNISIATNNGDIIFTANDSSSGASSANRTTTAGSITMNTGSSLNAGTGNVSLTVDSSTTSPFSPGNVTTVSVTGKNIVVNSPNVVTLNGAINATGTVAINANTDGVGANSFTMGAGSSITTTNTSASAVAVNVNAASGGTGTAALRAISTGNGGTITVKTDTGGNATGGNITWAAGLADQLDAGVLGTISLSTPIISGNSIGATGNNQIRIAEGTLNAQTGSSGILINHLGAGALTLGTINTSGLFTLNSTGSAGISNNGAITVTGVTTIAAGTANNVSLNNANNNFSTLTITSAKDTLINNINDLTMGNSTISGTLGVTAGGAITVGTLSVSGATANFTSSGNNNITFNSTINGATALSVNTSGTTTFTGAIGGTTPLLGVTTNAGGTTAINGGSIVTTNGTAGQIFNDDVTINATTTLNAGSGAITFGGKLNSANTTARALTLNSSGTTTFNGAVGGDNILSTITTDSAGSTAINGGSIATNGTQTFNDAVTLGADTTFTVNAASSDILLPNTSNNITHVISYAMNGGGSIRDISLANSSASAVIPNLPSGLRNVTFNFSNAGMNFSALNLTGTLNATAGGNITQSGALTISGVTTLDATSHDITLNNSANNFSTIAITNAHDVTLQDTNALVFGNTTVSGALNVTAGGAITDTGTLAITGNATFDSTGAITLNSANNDFSTVGITNGTATTLVDINAINLASSNINGAFTVTAGGNITQSGALIVSGTTTLDAGTHDITLNNAGNNFATVIATGHDIALTDTNAINLGATTATGTLSVTAGGDITDNGNLTISGITTLTAGANNITLDRPLSLFSGAIKILGANNVTLSNNNAIDLGASTISGNLNVTAGGITDSGAIAVTGTTTLAAGATNDIVLNTVGNDFGGAVTVSSGNNVTLVDSNAISFGTLTVSGALDVTAGGNITHTGILNVASGTSTFRVTAPNSNILLASAANNFGTIAPIFTVSGSGTIQDLALRNTNAAPAMPSIPSGLRDLTLIFNSAPMTLPSVTLTGNLIATAGGAITQSGALTVSGTSTFAAGASNNITLNNASNNFGTFSVTNGNNVSVRDINALDLGASTISGTFDVTANGNITDSGALIVTGLASFSAGSLNDITLDTATNNFSTISISNTKNATIVDTNALIVGTSTLGNSLNLTAKGAITQSGAITVPTLVAKTLSNAGAAITLNNSSNDISSINLQARNAADTAFAAGAISYVDANGVDLLQIGTTSTFNLTTNGAITDSGSTVVTGATTLAAGLGNDITLDNAANNFSTINITSGKNVTLVDTNALILGNSTISGNLNVTANGAITDSGNTSVLGSATFAAGSANSITLNSTGNNFNSVTISSANSATIVNANNLILTSANIANALTLTATGTLTTGAITTNGGAVSLTTLSPDSSARTLTINGNISTNGGAITANAANPDDIANALIVNGSLNTTGGVGQGTLTLGGGVELNTAPVLGGGSITLQGNGLDLTLGTLNFTSPIDFSVSRFVIVNGALTTTGGADITLTGDVNNTGTGGVLVKSTGSIASSGNLTLKGSSLNGLADADQSAAIEVQNGAAISAVGNISLLGNAGNGNILLNVPVQSTGTGSITMIAPGTGSIILGGNLNTNGGAISLNSPVTLNTTLTMSTHGGNLTTSTITGGGNNLTLDTGSTGDIIFNGNTSLNYLTLLNMHDFTNNGTIRVASYQQNAGNISHFGNSTLIVSENALINSTTMFGTINTEGNLTLIGNSFTGTVNVGSLNLDLTSATFSNSTVGGLSGAAGAAKIVWLNPNNANSLSFNGIILNPTTAPVLPSTPVNINSLAEVVSFGNLFPPIFDYHQSQSNTAMATAVSITMLAAARPKLFRVNAPESGMSFAGGAGKIPTVVHDLFNGKSSLLNSMMAANPLVQPFSQFAESAVSRQMTPVRVGLASISEFATGFATWIMILVGIFAALLRKLRFELRTLLKSIMGFIGVILQDKSTPASSELKEYLMRNALFSNVSVVSFNLRTAVNNMVGFGELILTEKFGPLTGTQKEYLSHIVSGSDEMKKYLSQELEANTQFSVELLLKVSFKLRTFLTTVAGFAHLLYGNKDESLTPENKEYVSYILLASDEVTRLAEDMILHAEFSNNSAITSMF